MQFRISSFSDKGARANQEDAFIAEIISGNTVLAMVADGVGGHNKGEFASDCIKENLLAIKDLLVTTDDACTEIEKIYRSTSEQIIRRGSEDAEYFDAGTTATTLYFHNNSYYLVHCGDTRAYLFRNKKVDLLTEDHTIVQDLLNNGEISEEYAHKHPERHMLTSVIGLDWFTFRVDTAGPLPAKAGDVFLLTSDGVHDVLPERALLEIMNENSRNTNLAQLICDTAIINNTRDNVTAVVITIL